MRSERLTRQELSWLLTQEARSAAERLRKGVAVLSAPETRIAQSEGNPIVEPALDALDDAMTMLASLHTGSAARGRKGRIDLAALLWEVAPNARVSIEPGGGTEVFGDEAELRRMLQVLVSSANAVTANEIGAPEISVRRDGTDVRVSVTLGPDSSAGAPTERAWLSRMAVRYGGRLELEGATESILLPADSAHDRREVEALRRELMAAQEQGEAYARELATVFTQARETRDTDPPASVPQLPTSLSTLGVLCAVSSGLAIQLRSMFAAIGRDATMLRETTTGASAGVLADSLLHRVAQSSELVAQLTRLGETPIDEPIHRTDLTDLVRTAMRDANVRASRRAIAIVSRLEEGVGIETQSGTLGVLVAMLLDEALKATPEQGRNAVELGRDVANPSVVRLTIDDGGAIIPGSARPACAPLAVDPTAYQRPAGTSVPTAHALAHHLGAVLSVGVAPVGEPGSTRGMRTALTFF